MSTVFKLARRGIRANLGRLAMTAIAITAGVGFVVAAFILADSLTKSFTALFEDINAEVDAQVTPATTDFGNDSSNLPDTTIGELAALPEVGKATGAVVADGFNSVVAITESGEEAVPQGPPVLAFSWSGESGGPLTLVEGSEPTGPDAVVLDTAYATLVGAAVGDTVSVRTPTGTQTFTLSGLVEAKGTLGAAFLLFDFDTAQSLFDKEGLVDGVDLSRAPGTTVEALVTAVEAVLPAGAEVQTSEEVVANDSAGLEQVVGFLRNALLGFAGIALFVSLFIIYNTFAILISQRLQQIGLLRSLGATSRQVKAVILVEALLIGLAGSVLGIAGGVGIAALIKAVFNATGGFPDTGTVITARTIVVAFGVGLLSSLASALMPAVAASRISPVAAMTGQRPTRAPLGRRAMLGTIITLAGCLLLGLGLAGRGADIAVGGIDLSKAWVVLIELAVGAILIFLGVAALSAIFAGRAAGVLGQPLILGLLLAGLGISLPVLMFTVGAGVPESIWGWITFAIKLAISGLAIVTGLSIVASDRVGRAVPPGAAAAGLEGHLAMRNAERSPRRTASTAIALTIGIALVAAVGSVGESLKASLAGTLDQSVNADLFITPDQGIPFDASVAEAVAAIDGIAETSGLRYNEVKVTDDAVLADADDADDPSEAADGELPGRVTSVGSYNAATGTTLFDLGVTAGGDAEAIVGQPSVLVWQDFADEYAIEVGDVIDIQLPSGNETAWTIAGIFTDSSVIDSSFALDLSYYDTVFNDHQDLYLAANVDEGADSPAVKAAVNDALAELGPLKALDNEEFIANQEGQVDGIITLVNALLGFALFVAFIGVVNTIALSVVERTREIGLLRAVGTTRTQVRSMVRWEAVIVCLFGAILGIALGLLFAWAATSAIPEEIISTLAVPYESIIFTVLVAALAGIVAAVLPALRASRGDVLKAIAT